MSWRPRARADGGSLRWDARSWRPQRRVHGRGKSIDNPAQNSLDRVARADRLPVVEVRIRDLDDLAALHGHVLEPALRSRTALVIESERHLTRLLAEGFMDPDFAYPYTLERAIYAATRLYRGVSVAGCRGSTPPAAVGLDAQQRRADDAPHDGVVQVIAPRRKRQDRGPDRARARAAPPRRGRRAILCTAFNGDARLDSSTACGLPVCRQRRLTRV